MIPTGTIFSLYGFAASADGSRLFCSVSRRVKLDHASRTLRVRHLRQSFPNTAKGYKSACAWSADANVRANAKWAPQVAR